MNKLIVQVENVTKIYHSNSHQHAGVVNVSLNAGSGELLLLLGPSGSGKTTLLTLIAGLIKPTEGHISLFNKNLISYSAPDLQRLRATRIGFIFQTFLLIDALNVFENINLVLRFAGKNGIIKN